MEEENEVIDPLFRLLMQSIIIIPSNIEQQKIQESPCTDDFIKSLEIIEITHNKLSCAICQEEFNINDKVHILPCKPQAHYFHLNNEHCHGILPWLKTNNTCPVCRFKFPTDKIEGENQEENQEENMQIESEEHESNMERFRELHELITSNIDIVRNGFSDRDVDEAIRCSLEE